MEKTKLFFLLFSMDVGGVEKSILGLLSAFDNEKYDLHIGLLRREGEFLNLLPEQVTIHDCFRGVWDEANRPMLVTAKLRLAKGRIIEAVIYFFLWLVFKITGDRSLFYKYLLRNDPAIDICFDEAYAYAGPAAMLDYYVCRKIAAKRRYGWIHFDVRQFGIDRVMTERYYRQYDKIYVVSEAAKMNFDSLFPQFADKTSVRYNIVNKDDIRRQADSAPTFDDDFNGKRILTVARLSAEKGQDITIEVLKRLVDSGYNVKWYYVGSGSLQSKCEQLAREYGLTERVEFLGMQTNPYGYMRDCDIYVQPSRHEGYSITLAEARCFTAPIVATDFAGAREQLNSYPCSAVTEPAAENIAEAVIKFL